MHMHHTMAWARPLLLLLSSWLAQCGPPETVPEPEPIGRFGTAGMVLLWLCIKQKNSQMKQKNALKRKFFSQALLRSKDRRKQRVFMQTFWLVCFVFVFIGRSCSFYMSEFSLHACFSRPFSNVPTQGKTIYACAAHEPLVLQEPGIGWHVVTALQLPSERMTSPPLSSSSLLIATKGSASTFEGGPCSAGRRAGAATGNREKRGNRAHTQDFLCAVQCPAHLRAASLCQ